MRVEVKRVNYFGHTLQEEPDSVELSVEGEPLFDGEPGKEMDARIDGVLLGLEICDKEITFEIENIYD